MQGNRKSCTVVLLGSLVLSCVGCRPGEPLEVDLETTYLSISGNYVFGAGLYDLDGDGKYEYHLINRYQGSDKAPVPIFHATFKVNVTPEQVEVHLNDASQPRCQGSARVVDGAVFAVSPTNCIRVGKNVLHVTMTGQRSRITKNVRFDLSSDEDYGSAVPICQEEGHTLTCPKAPCWSMSSQCLNGTFAEDGCCGREPILDGIPCDDGDPETATDRCVLGTCQGSGKSGDVDGDGIEDVSDRIIGNSQSVNTSIPVTAVTVRPVDELLIDDDIVDVDKPSCPVTVENLGSTTGRNVFTIYAAHDPMLRFEANLSNEVLDLSHINVDSSRTDDEIAFVAVDFEDPLPPQDKISTIGPTTSGSPITSSAGSSLASLADRRLSVFLLPKSLSRKVCVRTGGFLDDPIRLTSGCTGDGEKLLSCAEQTRGDTGEYVTCDTYRGEWLRVFMNGPGVAWQIPETEQPFVMDIYAKTQTPTLPEGELPHRLRGILMCTGEGGPDCSDTYCAPGYDLHCLSSRNACRYGTGACGRPEWPEIIRTLQPQEPLVSPFGDELIPLVLPIPVPGFGFINGWFPDPDHAGHEFVFVCVPAQCTPGATETCDYHPPGTNHHCTDGTRTCTAGRCWRECVPPDYFGPEICDGIDNDCDSWLAGSGPPYGTDEAFSTWPEAGWGWGHRLCDDYCGCTYEECVDGTCVREFHDLCDDDIICTQDECHPEGRSDDYTCTNEPRDDFCGSGSDDCFCDGYIFCNPDAERDPGETVIGCESFGPCGRETFCQARACCDDHPSCYSSPGTPRGCRTVFSTCWLDDSSCELAHEAESPCCDAGCSGSGDCGLYPQPVLHPVTGMYLGSVHCAASLFFPPDCRGPAEHPENVCNDFRCDVSTESCFIDPGAGCNDGLECTSTDSCIPSFDVTWEPSAGGEWTDAYHECQGSGSSCNVPFCELHPTRIIQGISVTCAAECGDRSGYGSADLACVTDPFPGAPSGCSTALSSQCEWEWNNALWDNCRYDFQCHEDVRYCTTQYNDTCDDGIDCTSDSCHPNGYDCIYTPIDDWCPGDTNCCDRELGCVDCPG